MPVLRTLFSGGDLFGVGARAAGWQHLDGYEIDPRIAAVARLNGFDVRVADVCEVDYEPLPPADHLHASPSCKRASQANTDATEAPEDLACADAVARAIAAHQGATFTLENVWGYRTFESFARIETALKQSGFSYAYWHLNAADYGVPQTRKRLILIARRGECRIERPHPTHRQGGDMFHAPWVGWYAAIADILDTLPETRPAPWQLARMPEELRETMLVGPGGYDGTVVQAIQDAPSFTVPAAKNDGQWRAFLVGDQSGSEGDGLQPRDAESPALSGRSGRGGGAAPRAYIVDGGNTQLAQIDSHARADNEPMFTVSASDGAKKATAAYLIQGRNAGQEWGKGYQTADEPSPTVTSADERLSHLPKAYTAGRWVRMTVQALGRFQTVPDDYRGLTAEINGNGVPCLLAQRIMESLRGIYARQ